LFLLGEDILLKTGKRVLFGVCGIGMGHSKRSLTVAKLLRKLGFEVTFTTYNNENAEILAQQGFEVYTVPPIFWEEDVEGNVDIRRSITSMPRLFYNFQKQLRLEAQYIKRVNPHFIISDSRLSTAITAKITKKPYFLINHVFRVPMPNPDLIPLGAYTRAYEIAIIWALWTLAWKHAKGIFVPDFPPPYTLSPVTLDVPFRIEDKLDYVGHVVDKIPEDLPTKDELRKELGFDRNRPLIFVLISGNPKVKIDLERKIFHTIKNFKRDYQWVVSLGDPWREKLFVDKGDVRILGWLASPFEYLKACDLLIARPGHNTVSEAIVYGKPILAIPTKGNTEYENIARTAARLEIARVIYSETLLKPEKVNPLIDELMTSEEVKRSVKKVQKVIAKYSGTKILVEKILDFFRGSGS